MLRLAASARRPTMAIRRVGPPRPRLSARTPCASKRACREVFALCRFEELSHAEIARRLGISRNTVVSHMVTALAALEWEMGERERDSQKELADVSCWIAFRASRQ